MNIYKYTSPVLIIVINLLIHISKSTVETWIDKEEKKNIKFQGVDNMDQKLSFRWMI